MVVLWTVDSTTNVENSEAFTFASCLQRAPPLLGEAARSGSPLLTIRSQVGEVSMNNKIAFASCLHRAPPLLGEEASSGSPLLTIRSQVGEASDDDDDDEATSSKVQLSLRSSLAMYMVATVLRSTIRTPRSTHREDVQGHYVNTCTGGGKSGFELSTSQEAKFVESRLGCELVLCPRSLPAM